MLEQYVQGQPKSGAAPFMRAQASLEQLIVIGLALAFVAAAFYIASAYSSDSVKISQGEDAVQRIAGAVDYVYSLGPNSKEYVTVYIPQDLLSFNLSGKRIVFTVRTSTGSTDIFANTRADLVGALPAYSGRQKILIEYLSNGKIKVGEAGLSCSPSSITRTFNASGTGSDTISVSNIGLANLTGIRATMTGSAAGFVSMSQPAPALQPGQNTSVGLSYSIPSSQASGTYGGLVEVDSANDGSCVTQLTIIVTGTSNCGSLCVSQGYTSGTCRSAPSACVSASEDYAPSNDYSCTNVTSPSCCCYPTADVWGPLAQNLTSYPPNASANQNITVNATCNDATTGNSYIKSAEMQVDGGAWGAMSAVDGTFSHLVAERVNATVGSLAPGQHIAGIRCTDTADNVGPLSYLYFNLTMADTLGPIVISMNHTDFPTTLTNVTETGTATDMFTGNANIQSCDIKLDSGAWGAVAASDGAYNSPTESFTKNFGTLTSGTHTVYARCTDALGNVGGVYNDTFGVTSVDVMLAMDRSGSMADPVTNAVNNTVASTTSSTFALVKSLVVAVKNGNSANISAQIKASASGCTASYEARVGSDVIASGNRTSTSYGVITNNVDVSAYSPPFEVDLYMKRSASGCTVTNQNFNLTQYPTKLWASQNAAKTFIDLVGNSTEAGLVSYSTSATTNKQLTMMDSAANRNSIKTAIDSITATGSTCLGCGIDNSDAELTSARSRYPNSTRVIIFLTDGQNNVDPPNPITSATTARGDDVIIYTIGFGTDADVDNLTNIALLTHGQYYYAPDSDTLQYIYQHIGQ